MFLNDIAGAFDGVDTIKLLAKMKRLGICETLVLLFKDYLAPRTARVAADGAVSDIFGLKNMVFQGIVFGPSLWNVFFVYVNEPAERNGAKERKFADELSVSKEFHRSTTNQAIVNICGSHNPIYMGGGAETE